MGEIYGRSPAPGTSLFCRKALAKGRFGAGRAFWGSRKGAPPRTLALLSRSPTKVESSRDGESGDRGRSCSLAARAGNGAAGGSSGRVTV